MVTIMGMRLLFPVMEKWIKNPETRGEIKDFISSFNLLGIMYNGGSPISAMNGIFGKIHKISDPAELMHMIDYIKNLGPRSDVDDPLEGLV